jgi:hypothetical protein
VSGFFADISTICLATSYESIERSFHMLYSIKIKDIYNIIILFSAKKYIENYLFIS